MTMTAGDVIEYLGLARHPEGGWFRETFRDPAPAGGSGGRSTSTAIYYLLQRGDRSAWHRVRDAAEVWHHYSGAPLALSISVDGRAVERHCLGADLAAGERLQAVVLVGAWQAAESLGDWTLVGCMVAPAFEFASFELAPAGWAFG